MTNKFSLHDHQDRRSRAPARTLSSRMKMLAAAGLIAAANLVSSAPAHAEALKFLVSWGPNQGVAFMPADRFVNNLASLDGSFDLAVSGPEAVPPFEQVAPVSLGVFDMLFSHPAYHSKGIAVALGAMDPDMDKMRSSGVFDFVDRYYQENHNLKILSVNALGRSGVHCYLREPLSAEGNWEGRKIRGLNIHYQVIQELGGAPVMLPMGDIYSGIEKGVLDGACAPAPMLRTTKHYEVAKYITEPTFGTIVSIIAINKDRWDGLSDAQKGSLIEAGKMTERDAIRLGDEKLETDSAWMKETQGVEITAFPPEVAAKVKTAFSSSIWAETAKCCGEDAASELRALARNAGLSD